MNINHCAAFVDKVEKWRSPVVVKLIEYLVTLPVERSKVQPYIDTLKEMHITCCKHAVEFFNGNNAELRFEGNYDRWYEQNARFLRYLPQFAKELHERFPEWVPADLQKEMDFSKVIQVPWEVRN
ncbi:MAG: hypothetical protein GC192_11680 [Bacteroidetes bacterium]|nr:hypothetical protein [Bacteroidota bacterium]